MKPRKILVVDDSKLMHKMFDVMLRQYVLVHAMDGLDGLEVLERNQDVDLILLDINMPKMDGLEFMTRFKDDSVFRDIPVVIVTMGDDDEKTARAMEGGGAAYIKKPFTNQDLHDLIAEL